MFKLKTKQSNANPSKAIKARQQKVGGRPSAETRAKRESNGNRAVSMVFTTIFVLVAAVAVFDMSGFPTTYKLGATALGVLLAALLIRHNRNAMRQIAAYDDLDDLVGHYWQFAVVALGVFLAGVYVGKVAAWSERLLTGRTGLIAAGFVLFVCIVFMKSVKDVIRRRGVAILQQKDANGNPKYGQANLYWVTMWGVLVATSGTLAWVSFMWGDSHGTLVSRIVVGTVMLVALFAIPLRRLRGRIKDRRALRASVIELAMPAPVVVPTPPAAQTEPSQASASYGEYGVNDSDESKPDNEPESEPVSSYVPETAPAYTAPTATDYFGAPSSQERNDEEEVNPQPASQQAYAAHPKEEPANVVTPSGIGWPSGNAARPGQVTSSPSREVLEGTVV
jgi:hypothetical protein